MTRSMSRVIGVGVCLLGVLVALPALADVKWAEVPYGEIIKQAQTKDQHVFVDFYTTWCGPCKKLEKVTYKDEKVIAFLNEMIAVKYDAEKDEGETLAKEFKVNAYPTLILIGPDGKEIDRHLGYLDPDEFVKVLTDYKNGIGTVAFYEERVKNDPKDPEAWKTLGMKHADAGRMEKATKALKTFLDLSPDVAGDEKAEVIYALADVNYRSESYDRALELYGKMTEEFADSEWHDRALVMGARAHHKNGNADECIEWYLTYVDRHPDDPKAMNSFAWFCASKKVGMDRALPVALKAVELSGRDASILDTLGELYYAMGEYDKAIEIGEEAVEKDPEDKYLADQLEKFNKAKKDSREEAKKQAKK
ncbi:MAG: tetratricopeptide repeat protein [Candidatus Latescibacterota bacterium]|nr:MAG: tetratricopeptide repeat protein [Candidatus Latescibacterota bacterium]